MKHHLRKEKICLNCGTTVDDNYCPHCGQENIEPRQSFGHLLYHFFADFTHFDSKFFTTIKDLILKPGFLTKEYISGKRKRYLDPVKMYIFISFVFFLTMGLLSSDNKNNNNDSGEVDSRAVAAALQVSLDSLKTRQDIDTATLSIIENTYKGIASRISEDHYASIAAYDSIQERLALKDRDSRFRRYITDKKIKWQNKYATRGDEAIKEKIMHTIPKVMFVLLPLFALFLKLFYRKKYYYFDHAIFSLHFHSLVFLAMLIFLLLDHFFKISIFDKVFYIIFFYLVLALSRTYHQSVVRSLFKGIAVSIMYLISIIFAIVIAAIVIFITI